MKNEQVPEKVDQLLDYVNSYFFEGKLDIHNKDWLKKTLKVSPFLSSRSNLFFRSRGSYSIVLQEGKEAEPVGAAAGCGRGRGSDWTGNRENF